MPGGEPVRRMPRDGVLEALARRRGEAVVVGAMTALGPWLKRSPSERNLINIGFMGGASTYGLGVALARPDVPVWVLDGDGSLLMQLGSLPTIAQAARNASCTWSFTTGSTRPAGGQPLPGEGVLSFAGMAREAGYPHTFRFDDVEVLDAALEDILALSGPVLVELITAPAGSFYQTAPAAAARPTPALATNWPRVCASLAADGEA